MIRGNGGDDIFFSDDDRTYFIFLLQEGIQKYSHRIHAYCQMTNHVHLVIQVRDTPLSRVMQNVCFRYTRFINARQKRMGHLFQGRYKSILIDRDNYLAELIRYIHCNPVRAKIVKMPEFYSWSSHNAYLGEKACSWLTTDFVLSQFDNNREVAINLYQNFVKADMNEGHRKEFHTGLSRGHLGDDKFCEHAHIMAREELKNRWSYDQVINSVCIIYGISTELLCEPGKRQPAAEARAVAAYLVQNNQYLSLTKLGEILCRDLSALSRAAGRLRDRIKRDSGLKNRMISIKKHLKNK